MMRYTFQLWITMDQPSDEAAVIMARKLQSLVMGAGLSSRISVEAHDLCNSDEQRELFE